MDLEKKNSYRQQGSPIKTDLKGRERTGDSSQLQFSKRYGKEAEEISREGRESEPRTTSASSRHGKENPTESKCGYLAFVCFHFTLYFNIWRC